LLTWQDLFFYRYWIFRSWGRVGTTIGGNKLEVCGSKNSAISNFEAVYLDKTGNSWQMRKNFTKRPNKFYPIDIDYGAVSCFLCRSSCSLKNYILNLVQHEWYMYTVTSLFICFEILQIGKNTDLKRM
jgi:hypothetical protein